MHGALYSLAATLPAEAIDGLRVAILTQTAESFRLIADALELQRDVDPTDPLGDVPAYMRRARSDLDALKAVYPTDAGDEDSTVQ